MRVVVSRWLPEFMNFINNVHNIFSPPGLNLIILCFVIELLAFSTILAIFLVEFEVVISYSNFCLSVFFCFLLLLFFVLSNSHPSVSCFDEVDLAPSSNT